MSSFLITYWDGIPFEFFSEERINEADAECRKGRQNENRPIFLDCLFQKNASFLYLFVSVDKIRKRDEIKKKTGWAETPTRSG